MSIKRISVILMVAMTIASNTVHCTPTYDVGTADTPRPNTQLSTTLPVSNAHTSLNDELLNVLKNFHSSLPGSDQKTPTSVSESIIPPLVNDRITIMHFPAASELGPNNGTTPNPMVPGVIHHQRPFGLDMQMPNRGNSQIAEPPSSLTVLQSRGLAGNHFSSSVPPTIAEAGPSFAPAPDKQSSPNAISPESSRSTDPSLLKIEPVSFPHNFNQELAKLLTDLKMTPSSLQESAAAAIKNQVLANGPASHPAETVPIISPGSPVSLQPSKDVLPILGPKQTPLDYLLSSRSPIPQLKSIPGYCPLITNTNGQPSAVKPRPNLEFVKYLLSLPRYQDALNELIKAQSSIQT